MVISTVVYQKTINSLKDKLRDSQKQTNELIKLTEKSFLQYDNIQKQAKELFEIALQFKRQKDSVQKEFLNYKMLHK